MKVLELFAGAGGAALGLEAAGFEHVALVEWDADACATLRAIGHRNVIQADVHDLSAIRRVVGKQQIDLIWSSFPCQAWSTAGKRRGAQDARNGWPWTVVALDEWKPRWFLGENVRGLTQHRGKCATRKGGPPDPVACPGCYFEHVVLVDLQMRFSCVGYWMLNAADFGVPQHRRRIFLWAGPVAPKRPVATHGPTMGHPWMSMGAALGLDGMRAIGAGTNPHGPGRAHERTERDITDEPAPAMTAERVGNAGPWLMRVDGGERRVLTWQECAVLQDFPSNYPFQGGVGSIYKQVGNAVPSTIAGVVSYRVLMAEQG